MKRFAFIAALVAQSTFAATASFVKTDTTTQGNWIGTYGKDGYSLVTTLNGTGNAGKVIQALPSYATFSTALPFWVWTPSSTDIRALQLPLPAMGRVAACWYTNYPTTVSGSFSLTFSDASPHRFSVYALDWDGVRNSEKIEILDAAGAVLDSRPIGIFKDGVYLTWEVTGSISIKLYAPANSTNGVISGVFLDPVSGVVTPPPPPPPPSPPDPIPTQLDRGLYQIFIPCMPLRRKPLGESDACTCGEFWNDPKVLVGEVNPKPRYRFECQFDEPSNTWGWRNWLLENVWHPPQ